MIGEHSPSVYVLDTHALYWYWTDPDRLGTNANTAFRRLEQGKALGLVPFIVGGRASLSYRQAS